MKIISYMGNTLIVILICIILILIPKTRWKYGIATSAGVIISTMFNNLLKVIFLRERPDVLRLINENSYSFPSGHSMINMTMYSLLAILLFNNIKNKTLKYLIPILVIFIPILMGLSRVYLGVHYITDVIGGWIFGLLITVIIYQIYKVIRKNKEEL
jgi:undecaprenyl-diphosphatase